MKTLILSFCASAFVLASCHNNNSGNQATGGKDSTAAKKDTTAMKMGAKIETKNGITLSYFIQSPDFADASLSQVTPANNSAAASGTSIPFKFDVKNFKLTDQTSGAMQCDCSNSNKGQHIHQILNNEPYIARYKDTFYSALKDGHYINLCFLSRSYHESVKNKNAYVLSQFNIGKIDAKPTDLSGPMLFYSRPKGEYKGKDTANVLLDFYLVNTDLSPDGNKIVATINGTPFTLSKWTGYSISGLHLGENTIKLELVAKDGVGIPGPYNVVERKIKLSAQ